MTELKALYGIFWSQDIICLNREFSAEKLQTIIQTNGDPVVQSIYDSSGNYKLMNEKQNWRVASCGSQV